METKELKIDIPEGFEIDKKNSTFEKIVFKKIEQKKWRDNTKTYVEGYYIDSSSNIRDFANRNIPENYNLFATIEQAKSALAMARISQILANDKRFGGPVTEKEWADHDLEKYVINRDCINNRITINLDGCFYKFLAFHEFTQASLFKKENIDLIKDYYMIS